MHLAQRRDHARGHGSSHRRIPRNVAGRSGSARQRCVHVLAGSRESNGLLAPVRRPRGLERARRRVLPVRQAQRGDGHDVVHHGRDGQAAPRVTLVRCPRVGGRRRVLARRIIQVNAAASRAHHVDDVLRRCIVDGTPHRLAPRRLVGFVRHPVLPRVRREGAGSHRNPVIGGPHEAAHHILGVVHARLARLHVDRRDAQRRVDAGHAAGDAAPHDCPGHLRAARRARRPPHPRGAGRDTVDVAGHGLVEVDAPIQIRDHVVEAVRHDTDRDGRAHDVHALRVQRTDGLQVPLVVARRGRVEPADDHRRVRTRPGPGLVRGTRDRVPLRADGRDRLVAEHRCLASLPHGVEGDARLGQRRAQVGREAGRTRLDEERAKGRVLSEHQSSQGRGLGGRALEGSLIRSRSEVHSVVGGQLVGRQVGRDDAGGDGLAGGRVLPRVGSRLRRGHGVRVTRDREGGFGGRIVVGVPVVVEALSKDHRREGRVLLAVGDHLTQVHLVGLQLQRFGEITILLLGGYGCHTQNVEVHVGDRRARFDAHLHDVGGQHGTAQAGPFAVTDAILDRADHRGRLVEHHRRAGVEETVASILRTVTRGFQAPVLVGGLLAHDADDLRARQRRVHRFNERGDAAHVRGGR